MNGFWKHWSESLEKGYLKFLNETKEVEKNMTGRGEINIVEKTPQRRKMAENIEEIRGGGAKHAVKHLRQARRCEQVAHRLELLKTHSNDGKAMTYIDRNKRALEKIRDTAEEKTRIGKGHQGQAQT